MSHTVPTEPPATLVPGTTWTWRHTLPTDYPAGTYTLSYILVGPDVIKSGTGWTFTAEDGSTYLVSVTAATTQAFTTPGTYRLVAMVTGPDGTFVAAEQLLEVQAGYEGLAGDQRTHDEKMVDLLEAAIEARASGASFIESYSIGGRSVSRWSTAELVRELGMYRARVWRRRNPGRIGRAVGVQFPKPGL